VTVCILTTHDTLFTFMFSPRYYAVLVIPLLERTEVTLVTKYVYGETVTQDFLLGRFNLGLGGIDYTVCAV